MERKTKKILVLSIGLILIMGTVALAKAATGIVRPNSDGGTVTWGVYPSGSHYSAIDDSISYPDPGDTSDYIYSAIGAEDEIEFETISVATGITQIEVWTYGEKYSEYDELQVDIYIAGSGGWLGENLTLDLPVGSAGWTSNTFNAPASSPWTNYDLQYLQVKYIFSYPSSNYDAYIYTSYCEVTYDTSPPLAITNLSALTGTGVGKINLQWTAPQEGDGSGPVSSYDVRYATSGFGNNDWNSSWVKQAAGEPPSPKSPGQTETMTVTGLTGGTTYSFRIKSTDDVGNISPIDTTISTATAVASTVNVDIVRPNVDGTTLQWGVAPSGSHYSAIDDTVTQPTPGWTSDYITEYLAEERDEIGFETIANADNITAVKVWTYGFHYYNVNDIEGNVKMGVWQSTQSVSLGVGGTSGSAAWTSNTFGGAPSGSWTKSDLDGLEVRYKHTSDPYGDDQAYIYTSYCQITWAPTPPAAVTNLSAAAGTQVGQIKLQWTAPKEDGTNGGAVSSYDVRYATYSFTDSGWASATQATGEPSPPNTPGYTETMTVNGLTGGTTYYFRIKSTDDVGNISSISNEANAIASTVNVDIVRPNEDVVKQWETSSGTTHYVLIDEPVTYPTPGTSDYIRSHVISYYDDIGFETVAAADNITKVKVWTYGEEGGGGVSPKVNVNMGGWQSALSLNLGLGPGWTSNEFTGSWTLSDLNDLKVRYLIYENIDPYPYAYVYTSYCEISHKNVAPAAITNLTGLWDSGTHKLTLSWSSPGDDGWSRALDTGSKYRINYSTYSIQWSTANYKVDISTNGVAPHTQVSHPITTLTDDATYYFQIWTADEVSNWSGLSNGATVWVNNPPAAITNLKATTGWHVGEVDLEWTAPKEDGNSGGKVSSYDVRYATSGFGDSDWDSSWVEQAAGEPSPNDPGQTETMSVTGLIGGTTYYFRIKSTDDVGSISPIDTTSPQANAMAAIESIGIVRPNGDYYTTWESTPSSNHYENIDEVVIQPADGNSTDYVWTYDSSYSEEFDFETIEGASGITKVTVWTWGSTEHEDYDNDFVNISMGGNWQTQQPLNLDPGNNYWSSNTFTGSWTKSDLDDLIVEYYHYSSPDGLWVWTSYCEVTYDNTPPAVVTNLSALTGDKGEEIKLSWTAPKEDGNSGGKVSLYDVRYATSGFGDSDWDSSWVKQAAGEPSPNDPGQTETMTVTGLQSTTTYYFRIKSKDDVNNWSGLSNEASATTLPSINVSKYTGGTPIVPPSTIQPGSTGECLGTFKLDGTGTISTMTITEYGSCDAANDLQNVKLFRDDGDGNWESGADTQVGLTTNFNASNKATFENINLTASATCYVHVVLDVKSTATYGETVGVEVYQNDIICTSTTTASSWPVKLGASIIRENSPPSFYDSSFRSQRTDDSWITTLEWNDDVTPNAKVEVRDLASGLRIGSSEVSPDTHTVLLMHLNGDTTDYSGNENHGTRYGGLGWISTTTWKSIGGQEDILSFDGIDDYVDLDDIIIPLTGTFECWWKPNETIGTSTIPIFRSYFASPLRIFDLYSYSDNIFYAGWYNSGNDDRVKWTMSGISQGNWYHVALTWVNGGDTILYINGVKKSSKGTLDATWNTSTGQNYLGRDAYGSQYAKMLVDEVRILNRALTAEEVATEYYSGLFRYSIDGGNTWYSVSGSTVAWSTGTVTGVNGSTNYETIYASNVPFNQCSETQNKIKFLISDMSGNISVSTPYTIKIGTSTIVSAYIDGTPDVPSPIVDRATANNCLGTFRFQGTGTISTMTITEYGTCSAETELLNVKLFQDDGDGNWEPSQDTTQLGQTTYFNFSNKATFSGFNLTAGPTCYAHVVLNVDDDASHNATIGIEISQASDVTCDKNVTATSWPVQLPTSKIREATPPSFNDSTFVSKKTDNTWITTDEWNDDVTPDAKVQVQDTDSGLRVRSTEVSPDSHTVLLMHLNGDTTDYSGHGNDGTTQGDVVWISTNTWKSAGGLESTPYFDGTNDWVEINDAPGLDGMTKLTIEAWVKDTKNDEAARGIVSKRTSSTSEYCYLLFLYTNRKVYFDTGDYLDRDNSDFTLPVNEWHHIAVTFDGTLGKSERKKFYYDGKLDSTRYSDLTSIPDQPSKLRVGILNADYGYSWQGLIDEVRILDRALTPEEIAADYYSGLFRYSIDGGNTWYSVSGSTVAWSTATFTVNGSTYVYASNVPFNQGSETQNKIKFLVSDAAGNIAISSAYTIKIDSIPPAAITDLTGLCDAETGEVTLSWSTPGDDNWTGTLPSGSKYIIDYSSYSVQWSTANYKVDIPTSSVAPHTQVSYTITGLKGDTTWYFQIWTKDKTPTNWSGLSNGATVWVNPVIGISISTDTYNFGGVSLGVSTHTVSVITVTNNGNISEDFGLSCATTTAGGSPWYPGLVGESSDYLDRFILRGVFNATEAATGDFGSEDTIEQNIRWSQATSTFTITGSYTGVNVQVNDNRNIWFRLDLPATSSTSKDQQITVTITGKKYE